MGPWRQTERGPSQCGMSGVGKFWKTQGNKHSREGSWPKWSPSESHWSQKGQDNNWLECLDQPVRLALKFSRRLTGLAVEKVGAKVFMHLLLNFQHGQRVPLSTQLSKLGP